MRKKHGITVSLFAAIAALMMVLIIGIISTPWIIYIGLKHLKDKIKL